MKDVEVKPIAVENVKKARSALLFTISEDGRLSQDSFVALEAGREREVDDSQRLILAVAGYVTRRLLSS